MPSLPADQFSVVTAAVDDGRPLKYELAESAIELAITKGKRKGETLTLRQVTRLGKGRQIHVLTGRQAGDLPGPEVIYKMGSRWREENYFLLQGPPGRRMKLHRAHDGELLQQTSMGVVLLVAAALSFAVSGQSRWCNTCGATTRC